MAAIAAASAMPTTSPNRMPYASEFTLFANQPIKTPAITPLMVDPITMPIIPGRTSGVNQAVSPSRIPSSPPRTNPKIGLFISFYYTLSGNPLTSEPEKEHGAHHYVRQHQRDPHLVARCEPLRAFPDALLVGQHRDAVEEARHIVGQLQRAAISHLRFRAGGLANNRQQRLRCPATLQQERQGLAQRVNVAARIHAIATRLLGRHEFG